jgi:hypothetical protein
MLGNDYVLPEGKNSVDVLRMPFSSSVANELSSKSSESFRFFPIKSQLFTSKSPNLTGTKIEFWSKKFNYSQSSINDFEKVWQDRLIIITEKRLFIVTKKQPNQNDENKGPPSNSQGFDSGNDQRGPNADLEIVDSIPLEEIVSIRLESEPCYLDDGEPRDNVSFISRGLRRTATILSRLDRSRRDESKPTAEEDNRTDLQSFERNLWRSIPHGIRSGQQNERPAAPGGFCEPILRIATQPSGFNCGQSYYFLLRQQDHPCIDGEDASRGVAPLRTPDHVAALGSRLEALVARRRGEHARETWFHRLQQRLHGAWDSIPFNVAVLLLILSNFVFTVGQVSHSPVYLASRE